MSRLDTEMNIWLATVRPDGRPHLAPIWFVVHEERVWVCTGADTVKTRNLLANPNVAFSLENGNAPVVGEGSVVAVHERPYPQPVVDAFLAKYGWDITRLDDPDGAFDALVAIAVRRWVMGGADS